MSESRIKTVEEILQEARDMLGISNSYYFVSDTGDETDLKPINEAYAPEVKIESETERSERLWRAVQEFSST